MDIRQIINDFNSLESAGNDTTYNVMPLYGLSHKLGASKEHYPVFFVSTSDDNEHAPNIVRELLSVMYDMTCTIIEGHDPFIKNYAIITLRDNDAHLQAYFIEIFVMMLMKMSAIPSKQELTIEVERLVTIFSALTSVPVKKIQGLWAELLIIDRSVNPIVLVNAWHSSPTSKYDFTSGRDKIEVKSTSSEDRTHRFSLDQLNPSTNSRLLIASVIVRESGNDAHGLSVKDLYDRICKRIPDVDVKIRLYSVIAQTLCNNIDRIDSVYFDYTTAADTLKYYDYQIIPRILKEDVPAGITEVKFSCNVSGLKDISNPESSFIKGDSQLFNSVL